MKVIIFGATGMVGQGALRESLLAADVEQVLSVGRRPTGVRHPKLREVTLADFADLTPIEDELRGYDACFYCLGVSSVGLDEAAYTKVSYDYPVAAAHMLARLNPGMTFIYVSGAGTKPDGRQMWARVKARTEIEVIKTFPNGYGFRPGFIQPTHGATSKTGIYRVTYALTAPLIPVLFKIAPKYVTSTDRLGRAMLRAARTGFATRIVENADLR
ncbi:NAD-dependent epimerase/dehydratase family protein [Actinoplanes sp. NPDC048967]|uniref:NAD-dependent epimerase/dehydratase family protein n=1 Tax=Actinoplanes sp. NPDC048967 TaxID=3155269 RepID=UPI003407153D